jgi:hypothetical protein
MDFLEVSQHFPMISLNFTIKNLKLFQQSPRFISPLWAVPIGSSPPPLNHKNRSNLEKETMAKLQREQLRYKISFFIVSQQEA